MKTRRRVIQRNFGNYKTTSTIHWSALSFLCFIYCVLMEKLDDDFIIMCINNTMAGGNKLNTYS